MTTNESATDLSLAGLEDFHRRLLACVGDITELLPGLSQRYPMPVIIDAMAEHVGSAMQALIHKNLCNLGHADQMVQQIEGTAFMRQAAQIKAEKAEEDPDTSRKKK